VLVATPELNEVYPSYELQNCPFPFFERLRAEAPVYLVPGRGDYLVSRHEDVAFALRRTDIFSTALVDAPGLDYQDGRPLLHFDPPDHTAIRLLAAPPFTPRRLRGIAPMIQQHVDDLIDSFIDRGELDFIEDFAFILPIKVISSLMNLPLEGPEFDAVGLWSRVDRSNTQYFPEGCEFDAKKAEIRRVAGNMLEHLAGIVKERYESPGDDIISEMVQRQVEQDGELDLGTMTSVTAELLAGGVTTTAHMMGSAMMLLIKHPEQFEKVLADYALIPSLLEETLRLEAPVQWRARVAKQEVELAGVTIPAGARVLLLFASGSRDEKAFGDPAEFCPQRTHRELKKHFGFGYGQHFCLGGPLARLEGKLAFETFLRRTKNVATVEELNDFTPIDILHFRAPRTVHLRFDRP
jgi:cytochrome P450